jgi:hypothetical protein
MVSAVNVGGKDLTMFFGVDGPYWTDLNGDNKISWALNTGNGNVASRTISTGSITLDSVVFDVDFPVLPTNRVITLTASDHVLTVGGISYGDTNGVSKTAMRRTRSTPAAVVTPVARSQRAWTFDSVAFDTAFAVLPTNRVITLTASDQVLTVGASHMATATATKMSALMKPAS